MFGRLHVEDGSWFTHQFTLAKYTLAARSLQNHTYRVCSWMRCTPCFLWYRLKDWHVTNGDLSAALAAWEKTGELSDGCFI